MTLPDSSLFMAATADRRFLVALAVAVLSGLVRGFSGFGSALIYMPLVAAVYDPRVAAVTLLLIDFIGAAPFAVRAVGQCTWREVLPIWIAASIGIPFGTLRAPGRRSASSCAGSWRYWSCSMLGVLMSGGAIAARPRLPVTVGSWLVFRLWRRRGADRGPRCHHLLARRRQPRRQGARQSAGLSSC